MNKTRTHLVHASALLALPGLSFAHHGPAEDLGGQLVHATFDPSHMGVTILVAGVLIAAYRIAAWLRRRS